MMRRIILPDRVLGRSGTTNIAFGAANGPIDLRTCRIKSFLTCSLDSVPSLRATKALTAGPVSSSLMPTTAASATESVLVSKKKRVLEAWSAKRTVLDECCLNLSSRQPVSRNVYDIVDAAPNPVVAFVITARTISSELSTLARCSAQPSQHLRSSPCTRSGMCPCIACVLPRLCEPYWATAA